MEIRDIVEIPKCERCGLVTPNTLCRKCRATQGVSIVGEGNEDDDQPLGVGMSLVFTAVLLVVGAGAVWLVANGVMMFWRK